jgi:hypothetical protein
VALRISRHERLVATDLDAEGLRVSRHERIVAILPLTAATFDCDASHSAGFTASQVTGIVNVDTEHGAEFTGTGSRVGRFECAAPETSVEFSGRQRGPVVLTVDAPHTCSWIVGGGIVPKDCLAGDGRYAETEGDPDLEQNYVF